MIIPDADHVLFIEPAAQASSEPLIDRYTRHMAGALRAATPPPVAARFGGVHTCVCGATSANYNLDVWSHRLLRFGRRRVQTNTLAVHYLAHHRDEVPAHELAKVLMLEAEPAEPLASELLP